MQNSLQDCRTTNTESVNVQISGTHNHVTVYNDSPSATSDELAELWQQLATVQFQLIEKLKARTPRV